MSLSPLSPQTPSSSSDLSVSFRVDQLSSLPLSSPSSPDHPTKEGTKAVKKKKKKRSMTTAAASTTTTSADTSSISKTSADTGVVTANTEKKQHRSTTTRQHSTKSNSQSTEHSTMMTTTKTTHDDSKTSSSTNRRKHATSASVSSAARKNPTSNSDESGNTMNEDSLRSLQEVILVRKVPPTTVDEVDQDHNRERSRSPLPPRPSSPAKGARYSPKRQPSQPSYAPFSNNSGHNNSNSSINRTSSHRTPSMGSLSAEPERPKTVITDEDARFHNCIKEGDWKNLEKLLSKFDPKYYKRMEQQAQEKKEKQMAELEAAAEEEITAAAAAAAEEEAEESARNKSAESKSPRQRRLLSMMSSSRRSNSGRSMDVDTNTRSNLSSSASPRDRSSRFKIWKKSSRDLEDPSEIVSPLLMVDDMGRTPLHLALCHQAPESLVLEILSNGKKAALIRDNFGQLPLHIAVNAWQYDHILEKIIKAYPNSLKTKDDDGRTPIGLAVRLARQRQETENPKPFDGVSNSDVLWIQPPLTKKDKSWQFEQEKIWSKVNFLLKDLMRRNKSLIPSEHGLILEGLEAGADPNTINRLVSTTDKYLATDDELLGAAIGLCIERQYCLDNLEYIMEKCRNEKSAIITQAVHRALNSHYRFGCRPLRKGANPFGKQVIDWAKEKEKSQDKPSSTTDAEEEKKEEPRKPHRESGSNLSRQSGDIGGGDGIDDDDNDEDYTADFDDSDGEEDDVPHGDFQDALKYDLQDALDDEDPWPGMDQSCRQWWETMIHLLFSCAYGRRYKTTTKPMSFHVVHAALSIPSVQPSLIQLLWIIYPDITTELCPLYRATPIHIACSRWRYDALRADGDSSLERVLKLILKRDPEQAYSRHKGRLPIHIALSVGQSWTFLKPFISIDELSVGMRDPHSKFFPFQMAALPLSSKNAQLLMRHKFTPADWRLISKEQKKFEFDLAEQIQERKQVGTIFELLIRHPDAVKGKPIYRQSTSSRALRGLGRVALQYLSFVYCRNVDGGFRIKSDNLKLLRDAILRADIPLELESWWDKMKECIWEESNGDVPKVDSFLLHAALFNPETPPLITELLLEVFPASVSKPLPGTNTLPLHIAAGTATYLEQSFESPYGKDSLQLVVACHPRAARSKSNGRLPIHIALAKGKSWKDVRSLVRTYPSSLLVEDPQTGLLPFQLMASFDLKSRDNALRYAAFIERKTRMIDFDSLPIADKAAALSKIRRKQKLNHLTCIFELLRYKPSAMTSRGSMYVGGGSETSFVSSACASDNISKEVTNGENEAVSPKKLPQFLTQVRSPTRVMDNMKDLLSPLPTRQKQPFVKFMEDQMSGSIPSLDTPLDSSSHHRIVFPTLPMKGSSHRSPVPSTGSLGGGSLYNQSSRPKYNDDLTTSLHSQSTYASSFNDSAGSYGNALYRYGKPPSGRSSRMPIRPPDIGVIDIDDDDI